MPPSNTSWLSIADHANLGRYAAGLEDFRVNERKVDPRIIDNTRDLLFDAITRNTPGFVAAVNMVPEEHFDVALVVAADQPLVDRISSHPRGQSILHSLATAAEAKALVEERREVAQIEPSHLRDAAAVLGTAADGVGQQEERDSTLNNSANGLDIAAMQRVVFYVLTAQYGDVSSYAPFAGPRNRTITTPTDAHISLRTTFLADPEGALALLRDDTATLQVLGNAVINDGPSRDGLGASLLASPAGEELFYAAVTAGGDLRLRTLPATLQASAELDVAGSPNGLGAAL